MSYRPHSKARVDPHNPQPFAVCDRCGDIYNHNQLRWQMEWAGTQLVNQGWLVCPSCLDPPTPFLRTFILPADPVPIKDPRPFNYTEANSNYIATQLGEPLTDASDNPLVTETTTASSLLIVDD